MSLNRTMQMLAASTIFLASAASAENAANASQEPASVHAPATVGEVIGTSLAAVAELPALPATDELSDSELQQLRGGESIVVGNQTLLAITSGNIINGNYTAGNVTLSDNAFSNFNGLGNVLINTGAQVSLQTGMNVTINVGD